jgi:hypothetical protein
VSSSDFDSDSVVALDMMHICDEKAPIIHFERGRQKKKNSKEVSAPPIYHWHKHAQMHFQSI